MTLKRVTTSVAVAAISAMSLLPMAGAANARDFGRHGGHGPRLESHQFKQFNNGGRHGRSARWHKRRHHGRDLAIGAFAAIIGLAIAAEASRAHADHYYDEHYRY